MKPTLYVCNICNEEYEKRKSYSQHLRRKHGENSANRNIVCYKEDCKADFFNITAYRDHLIKEHDMPLVTEEKTFATDYEFHQWKKEFEQTTNERFVKNTGIKKSATSIDGVCFIYDCHRSGFVKKGALLDKNRGEQFVGSCKINGRCPSQMIFQRNKDGYGLRFHRTHTHEIDARLVNLSERTCETICAMMKAGLSEEHILKHFKQFPETHRDRWVDEKDLNHVANRFELNNVWRSHSEDSKSVHLFVHQNPDKVIFYQPEIQKEGKVVQELILVLQTQRQVDYIRNTKKFRVICVDSTHKIVGKKKMATIMTVNEDEQGVSLAFCFCNSENKDTMQIFFSAVKKTLGFQLKLILF